MASPDRSSIRQRALGAVFRNALLSWQVALTVVITLVLYFFVGGNIAIPGWQDWFWLVGGGLAAAAFLVAVMTDPQASQEAIAREFEKQFDLGQIRNRVARKHLQDALEYRRNMLNLAKGAKGSLRIHLMTTVDDINDWIGHMYDLAKHLDGFEDNELVRRDREQVPGQLAKVKQRLEREADPTVRKDLERQVANLEQQLMNLDATINSARRAEIQLESTLSSLGTVYAQMARLNTTEVDSGRAQRLRLEIQDEVTSLQDTIDAMDEVQAQQLRLR
jgi:hypothetical protein